MENQNDNTWEGNETEQHYSDPNAEQQYSDPNADQQYSDPNADQQYNDPNANQQYTYQYYNNQQYRYQGKNQQYQGRDYSNGQNPYGQQNYNYQGNDNYNANYSQTQQNADTSPVSMGSWIVTLLVACIPCVGIVLYFVWAFSSNGNVNRRNFCRAALIIMGICLAVCVLFTAVFGVALTGSGSFGIY